MEHINEQHRRQMLQSYNLIFALELLDVLSPIVIEQCYGWSVDHPSQVQHSCIMESKLSHLWMYFDLQILDNFFELGLRGGVSMISKKYSKANHPEI